MYGKTRLEPGFCTCVNNNNSQNCLDQQVVSNDFAQPVHAKSVSIILVLEEFVLREKLVDG